jgi:hypothetical protein
MSRALLLRGLRGARPIPRSSIEQKTGRVTKLHGVWPPLGLRRGTLGVYPDAFDRGDSDCVSISFPDFFTTLARIAER